mgnify:CR=1 FL=1
MVGTSKEVQICGRTIHLGDYLRVRYTKGINFGGAVISGKVVELWSPERDNHLQGRLSSGWCFHDHDEIIEYQAEDSTHDPK